MGIFLFSQGTERKIVCPITYFIYGGREKFLPAAIFLLTGYVKFDGSDAAEIFVETDTGDVTGTLLSEKVFIVQTDTGSINVPKTVTGGRCEISTGTGDIRITCGM